MIRDLLKNNQYLYCPENPEKCEDHRKASGGILGENKKCMVPMRGLSDSLLFALKSFHKRQL